MMQGRGRGRGVQAQGVPRTHGDRSDRSPSTPRRPDQPQQGRPFRRRADAGQFDDAPPPTRKPKFAEGSLAAKLAARQPEAPTRAEQKESKYASMDLADIAALDRFAGRSEGTSARAIRGMGRGNFRSARDGRGRGGGSAGDGDRPVSATAGGGVSDFQRGGYGGQHTSQPGSTGRGGRAPPKRRGRRGGAGGDFFAMSDRDGSFNFTTPAPTTVLDAKGNYTFATAAPGDLSPDPVQASATRSAKGTDYESAEKEVAQTLGQLEVRVPGAKNAIPLKLPSGIDIPKPSSSGAPSTSLTPLRWSDLVPETGAGTREEAVGKAVEAMAHHNPSMQPYQKAKTAALIGFVASNRQEREQLIRKQ